MAENIVYRLEITMEARSIYRHKYIKRSFLIKEGKLDIGKYGYPYSNYNSVEIIGINNPDSVNPSLKLVFDGEEVTIELNSFVTVKRGGETTVDSYMKVPVTADLVHTTFYLFIE